MLNLNIVDRGMLKMRKIEEEQNKIKNEVKKDVLRIMACGFKEINKVSLERMIENVDNLMNVISKVDKAKFIVLVKKVKNIDDLICIINNKTIIKKGRMPFLVFKGKNK